MLRGITLKNANKIHWFHNRISDCINSTKNSCDEEHTNQKNQQQLSSESVKQTTNNIMRDKRQGAIETTNEKKRRGGMISWVPFIYCFCRHCVMQGLVAFSSPSTRTMFMLTQLQYLCRYFQRVLRCFIV